MFYACIAHASDLINGDACELLSATLWTQEFKTTQSLRSLQPEHGLAEVVGVVAGAAEFERALYLRVSEKVPLFEVNKSSRIRFPSLEVKPGKQKPVSARRARRPPPSSCS